MIFANQVQAGLSDSEFDELGNFLQMRCLPNGGMNISMLDGYLTSIVSCPESISPSEWLPRVWGDGGDADHERPNDDSVTFDSMEEAKWLAGLVLRRMNEIIRDFEQQKVQPIFLRKPSAAGVAEIVFADVWCVGYLRGMMLRAAAWEPLEIRSKDAGDYLAPIFALALPLLVSDSLGDDDETPDAAPNAQARDKFTELVPHAAYAIHQYWRDQRRVPPATIRRAPQAGRNAACPCGSGRKYKKCCGRS